MPKAFPKIINFSNFMSQVVDQTSERFNVNTFNILKTILILLNKVENINIFRNERVCKLFLYWQVIYGRFISNFAKISKNRYDTSL